MQLMLSILNLGTLVLIGLVLLYIVLKERRIHSLHHATREETRLDIDNLFKQLSILAGIYLDLGLKKGLPPTRGYAAAPDFLSEITNYALKSGPRVIVECSSGVSTILLARCMQINGAGHVYSLEHLSEYADETRLNLARHNLTDWATVLDAPLRKHVVKDQEWLWYSIEGLPKIEINMIVIDGPPQTTGPLARYPAGPLLFSQLASCAAVFVDDTIRPDERLILQTWAKAFPELQSVDRHCERGCVLLLRTATTTSSSG